MKYDIAVKSILLRKDRLAVQNIAGSRVHTWLNVELPVVRNPRVDLVGRREDGKLHQFDLQAENDALMPLRMAEYNLGIRRLMGEDVLQSVLYIGNPPMSMSNQLHGTGLSYEFDLVDARDIDGEPLIASADLGDNILRSSRGRNP